MSTNVYAYYPGCTLHSTAKEYDVSARAVCRQMGIELQELEGWTCCGASSAHTTNPMLATALAARDLRSAEATGLPLAVACAMCFNRLKHAEYALADKAVADRTAATIGGPVTGRTEVVHLLQILDGRRQSLAISRPLAGLKVASYYGCLLVRPQEITRFDDPEDPRIMDRLMAALGAQPLEWDFKTACCGASLPLTRKDIVVKLSHRILAQAKRLGADCVAVACPMCQMNLDAFQNEMKKQYASEINLPILYFTQIAGLAMGLEPGALDLDKHFTDPMPMLKNKGLA